MPYNSSAFEKQLAKHKEQQAGKKDVKEDTHIAKARVEIGRGAVVPTTLDSIESPEKEAPETLTENVALEAPPQKPFYKKGWFTFLLFSVVISATMPAVFKAQFEDMMGMANSVHGTSGVAIFSPETYRKIFSGDALTANRQTHTTENTAPSTPENPIKQIVSKVKAEAAAKKDAVKAKIESVATPATTTGVATTPAEMHDIVNMATQKAQEVTAQGPEKSMEYIESEAKRLEEMAKQFDETYGNKKP